MGSNSSTDRSQVVKKTTEVPGLKIAVIGDSEVGKSCVLDRYIDNLYSPVYIPTRKLALRNIVRKLNIPGHATVPITFWDIPGQEDLDIHHSYFRNLDAVIVVVDASSVSSIETAKLWRLCVISNASYSKEEGTKGKADKSSGVEVEETMEDSATKEVSGSQKSIETLPFLLLGNKKDLLPAEVAEDKPLLESGEKEVSEETQINNLAAAGQRIEEASKDGFVGSVLVSAKYNDLSVHAAIQSFLRHVLEKRYVERRWKGLDKTPKIKKQRYEFSPQLETVGINEIDEEFSKADEIMHRVRALQNYQNDSLAKFASQCVDIDVIDSTKNASMQNCLVALRNKLASLDLKLKLVLVDELFTLEVKADVADAELESNIRYTIKTFNKEYVAVTLTMMREYPLAEEKLEKLEQMVEKLCLQFKVPSVAESSQAVTNDHLHRKASTIERNRAKMRHTVHECKECLTAIQALIKQVKTAFVW